VLFGV
jgi:hypothetical protein